MFLKLVLWKEKFGFLIFLASTSARSSKSNAFKFPLELSVRSISFEWPPCPNVQST